MQIYATLVQRVNNTQWSASDSIILGTCACASVHVLKMGRMGILLLLQLLLHA